MPAPTQQKRVKGKRITRGFIIGSEAWPLDETNRPEGIPGDHTTGWRVYVKAIDGGPDITSWLKKVQFKLFHTYNNPLRTVESQPFEVHETGWGGFTVDVRLHFQPIANEKPQWRTHYLQLEPYGSEEDKKLQLERKRVVSETVDFIEFNEPTEGLWDALTDETQWDYLTKGTGKGKGGRTAKHKVDDNNEERFAVLPAVPTATNPYSLQMETQVIDMLREAEKEVAEQLEQHLEKKRAVEAKLSELQASGDAVTKKK